MPSCLPKLAFFWENEFNKAIEFFSGNKEAIFHFSFGSTCDVGFCRFTKTVNYQEVCCSLGDVAHNICSYKLCLPSIPYTLCVLKFTKNIHIPYKTHWRTVIKYYASEVQSIYHKFHYRLVLRQKNYYVIHLVIIYILLKVSLFFILQLQLKFLKSIENYSNQIYFIFFDCKLKTVMELEEPGKSINSFVKNLPNGDTLNKVNSSLYSLSENEKSDDDCLTVIKDNQTMKGSEYSQVSNNIEYKNSIDIKIKEEINESTGNDTLPNGNINTNCYNNCNNIEIKAEVFVQESQTDKKLNVIIKDNGSNEDVNENSVNGELKHSSHDVNCELKENSHDVKCEIKENSHDVKCEEIKSVEKVKSESKSNESSSGKDKSKDRDHSNSNHVSSSSKKYGSLQSSSSSSSSSSSRHKYKDSRDDKHKSSSSSSHSKNESLSSSRRDDDKSRTESRSKSSSCHHKPEDKCHCKSRHRSHHRSKYQSVKTQCTADEIAFDLKQGKMEPCNPYFTRVPWVPHPQLANLKYGRFYRIEEDRNGGATVCHLYMDEISHLSESQMKECAIEFIKLSYSEDENECAYHVMGIVHGAASYLPDLVDYMADHYPTLIVKTGSLASRDNHTTTMSQYRDEVYKTYSNGTFRYAPLDQLSICGVLGEEVGAYFPDFVARLEQSPFMKPVMPWSSLSVVQTDNPRESNDGPIFWVRPGEQMLPANEALKESSRPKKRRNNELDNLAYIGGCRFSEARESLFMDRTKAHADQVGVDYGISNTAPTAAVGVLKAVNCGHPEHGNRATKDVVAFHAQDYNELLEILMLDLYEPPQTQCTKWIEVSKLNTLRREGIRYAHLQLHDNDVYYLPRKIVHQFQTISSVASVAWHIRYREYFSVQGAPNLHTPTGINKGQVFYEKKNVAVYCPPICENDFLSAVANFESGLKTPKKSDRLREYSPFKHSPRKMHKHQSPRVNPKKEKQSESVPQPNDAMDREAESNNKEQEKKNGSSTKKPERPKSTDERKRSRDEEPKKSSEKNDNSHHRSDRTPCKKEKSQDNHSSHRKEVKNLESDFDGKKDKSGDEKSPKSNKYSKSRDESKHRSSKHDSSSKVKSTNGSLSSSSSSSSSSSNSSSSTKHSKSESKSEKKREHGPSSSSKQNSHSHKLKTEDKSGESRLKRNHSESSHHTPSKRHKSDEGRADAVSVVENGEKSPEKKREPSDNPVIENGDQARANGDAEHLDNKAENKENNCVDVVNNNCAPGKGDRDQDSCESLPKSISVNNENCECGGTNGALDLTDLRNSVPLTGFACQVPPLPPPLPPPPPSSTPPLPPDEDCAPARIHPAENSHAESYTPPKEIQVSNGQENCTPSKDKTNAHVKKVKKKLVKRSSESFDLLGDIMSKMDKKSL